MAHLWIPQEGRPWTALVLDGPSCDLNRALPTKAEVTEPEPDGAAGERRRVVLVAVTEEAGTDWALLAGPERRVWVNGSRVELGMRLLDDRDHIRLDDGRSFYFSTEVLARLESYPGNGRSIPCPRCGAEITPGSIAVQCPVCRVWHHQGANRACWTYAPTCAKCDRTTELDRTGFQWVPDGV